MAISREDITTIAKESAEKVVPAECKSKCMLAGMSFAEAIFGLGGERYPAPVYPINVAGLVKESDLIVPHSELAMHVNAAGKELMAWSIREDGRYARIVYQDDKGCCSYTHGLTNEVLSPELIRVTKDVLHIG